MQLSKASLNPSNHVSVSGRQVRGAVIAAAALKFNPTQPNPLLTGLHKVEENSLFQPYTRFRIYMYVLITQERQVEKQVDENQVNIGLKFSTNLILKSPFLFLQLASCLSEL